MFGKKEEHPSGLKIIIVGCGKVGSTLVEQLDKEGHDITVIDTNATVVQDICNQFDVIGFTGNGASYSVQKEAGIYSADLIIAVTNSDELNLLCCTIAKRVGNCNAIARVRNPEYNTEINYLRGKLELAMIINPEYEVAREAARILALPSALDISPFAHGQAELIRFKVPANNVLDNMKIADIGQAIAGEVLICAIERDGEVFIPSGDSVLKTGDVISFVSARKKTRKFLEKIGFQTKRVKDTMIVGGGKASYYLAKQLLRMGISVKIIEQDRAKCEELSILLPEPIIINGDGTDQDLLKEEGLPYAESFVPLTGIDEENILLSLFAQQESNAKVITKVNRTAFNNIINQLDLGSILYPRYITTEAIIAYVRARANSKDNNNIDTLYHLFNNRVEAIEFSITEESDVTNISLKDLTIKKGVLVSFINRNGSIIIPSGSDCIKLGDTVMVVTTHTGFYDICDILQR